MGSPKVFRLRIAGTIGTFFYHQRTAQANREIALGFCCIEDLA
jgi:hypothetical protein